MGPKKSKVRTVISEENSERKKLVKKNCAGKPRQSAEAFPRPLLLDLLLYMSPVSIETQLRHAWNPCDKSPIIIIKPHDKLTFYCFPTGRTTACIRGQVGFSEGIHCWEICWPKDQRGLLAVVGVATAETPLNYKNYNSLIGKKDTSWGWDLVCHNLHKNLKKKSEMVYPTLAKEDPDFEMSGEFLVVLDMEEGTLSFVMKEQYLGVAFTGLKGKKLYPFVFTGSGDCNVTLRYIVGITSESFPLEHLYSAGLLRRPKEDNFK